MEKHREIYRKGNIRLIYTDFINRELQLEETAKNENERVWVFSYCLEGQTSYRDQRADEVFFRKGQSTACIHQCCNGIRVTAADNHIRQLRISVQEQELIEYFGLRPIQQLAQDATSIKPLYTKKLTLHGIRAIQTLLWHIRYRDRLQVHIGVLNLLHENLVDLGIKNTPLEHKPRQRSVRLAEEAKKMFDQDCTLRIGDVAMALHTSEQKLRSSFFEYYKLSPKQYSLKIKMTKAQALLATGMSVAEVGYTLGYEFPSNFTLAFKKYFGGPPSLVRSNKNKSEQYQ